MLPDYDKKSLKNCDFSSSGGILYNSANYLAENEVVSIGFRALLSCIWK